MFLELTGLHLFVAASRGSQHEVSRHREETEAYAGGNSGHRRPTGFDKRIEGAQKKEDEVKKALEIAERHQECVRKAIQNISKDYHPYNLKTGNLRSNEDVSASLEKHFSDIEEVASEANLPERCIKKIKKAKRVVVDMIATIAFFFLTVRAKVEALSLAPEVEWAVYNNLIPAIYLSLVSEKADGAEQRLKLRKRSKELLDPLLAKDGPFRDLDQEEKLVIEQVATECAQLFRPVQSTFFNRSL